MKGYIPNVLSSVVVRARAASLSRESAHCRRRSGAERRVIGHALLVVAQRDVHEDVPHGGLEADHQRFRVFAGLVALLRGQKERRMYAEMEALVVERGDGVAHDLVRQL